MHMVYQVQFTLSSSAVFSRSDITTDSKTFYSSVMDYFEDLEEQEGVQELLVWWNWWGTIPFSMGGMGWLRFRQVFPGYSSSQHLASKDGAWAIMKAKQAALRSKALNSSAQTVSNQSPTTKTQGWTKCRLDDSHTACRSFNVCIVKLRNWMKSTTDPVCLWIPTWHKHDRCWPSAMTYLFCQRIGFCAFW